MRSRWRRRSVVALLVLAGLSAWGSHTPSETSRQASPARATPTPAATTATPTPSTRASTRPSGGTALAVLATLPVKGRAPKTGYAREQFGQAWLDVDRNGCDTRNDVLRRDLRDLVVKAGTHGCRVEAGTLHDGYTGTTIGFVRDAYGGGVDVDHVVALSNAWQTGAFRWPVGRRAAFANDPLELLAADASANRQKGDGDAATWLPPNRAFRCAYAARQVAVKAKYELWVTPPEQAALRRVLDGCPDQRAPRGGAATEAPFPVSVPTTVTTPAPAPTDVAAPQRAVSYANCDAVRAAGAAPIHAGDPGYASHLDRDGDGTGCE